MIKPAAPEPWDAIDRDLLAEVGRLVDRKVLTTSQKDELLSAFRSVEQRVVSRFMEASGLRDLSPVDKTRAALRARMSMAVIIESAGTEWDRAVAIRRRIVALEKSLGVFETPTVIDLPPDRPSLD